MSQKVSYLIIGLLIGLLLREWAARPAESQTSTSDIVAAQGFYLVDADGKIVAGLFTDSEGEPILGIGRPGEPGVLISADARGALLGVTGNNNNKTTIDANATLSRVISGVIAVENSLNRGHAVRLSTTTQGGRVATYRNLAVTGRLPTAAGKLVAGPTNSWGQVKAGELAEDEPTFEPAAADDAEFERLQREYEARIETIDQR